MAGLWPERAAVELVLVSCLLIFALLVARFILACPNWPKTATYAVFRTISKEYMQLKTAGWPSLPSRHFHFRYEAGTGAAAARLVLAAAEEYYGPVQGFMGRKICGRVPLIVYRDRRSLGAGFGWEPDESAMGVYWAGVVRILSPSDWVKTTSAERMADVFRHEGPMAHELAHLLVDYRAGGNYPRWLTEGIAQQVERAVTGFAYRPAAGEAEGNWYPVAALDRGFDDLPDQDLAYRQSLLLVDYISSVYGPQSPGDLLDALGRGLTWKQALRSVLGVDAAGLETGFFAWVQGPATRQQVAAAAE